MQVKFGKHQLNVMKYETLDLTIPKEQARDVIAARVDGVRIREFHEYYEFTSLSGFHLAELSDRRLPNGERGARIKYRTAIVSPVAATARSKAREIKNAVEKYRYQNR
ncbi:uncharacterized protein HfgLR_20985 (plasmid) [Haloferax gibbonsii]|uniref:Uncharacterized protein n=1 Tax=Haloferax gibbonsii TaxID=35746 RepID=A0A871BKA0_HALGI|nr:uncharacterized protein HfgLR_20985 [Haloferax gibbonsii]